MAMAEQARARAARRSDMDTRSQQVQGGASQAQSRDDLGDMVSPAEIDRVIDMYRKNAEPDVAARMDRAMAEKIIRDRKARIRAASKEMIHERVVDNIDYYRRVLFPRDLARAYGLHAD